MKSKRAVTTEDERTVAAVTFVALETYRRCGKVVQVVGVLRVELSFALLHRDGIQIPSFTRVMFYGEECKMRCKTHYRIVITLQSDAKSHFFACNTRK